MRNNTANIVKRLWNYCNVLRDDGVSYSDYVEQLTYLIFLRMADDRNVQSPTTPIPSEYSWSSLINLEGDELEVHYRKILTELGQVHGLVGTIFHKAQNRIQDPAKLHRLIKLIDEENWNNFDIDVKGEIYEGILEKNAQDVKSGAGQYFTPRPLIQAIVDVMKPAPGQTICDPACGTGGFLLAAYDYILKNCKPDEDQLDHLRHQALHGWEIVDDTARLCVMNFYLHGIGANGDEIPIRVEDSLASDPGIRFNMVLSNPPFGKSSSATYVSDPLEAKGKSQAIVREDFWTSSSNKQLNFVQHIYSILEVGGKAAVIVPDNVLFEGGAGETIRRQLIKDCNMHTLLRLPKGIFYAHGVNANVLFFDKLPDREEPWTEHLWIYDLRTNKRFTLRQNPLTHADLDDFVNYFGSRDKLAREIAWSETNQNSRWRVLTYDELLTRDKVNFDIFWLRDESLGNSEHLPPPDMIATEILEDLEAVLEQIRLITEDLDDIE